MKKLQRIAFSLWMGGCALLLCWSLVYAAEPGETAAAVTVESTTPIESVAATFEPKKPVLTFGLDRIPELRRTVLEIPLWQYLATAIYILLALLAAKLLDYLLTVQLQKFTSRIRLDLADAFVGLLHSPVKILTFVLLAHVGFNLFPWPEWVERWVKAGLKVLLAFSLTFLTLKLIDAFGNYWKVRLAQKADKTFNDLLIPLISKCVKVFVVVMAVLVTLDNLNFNIRTLLAGVSIGGLAIGLAAQDTVGNLFGAAAVFMDQPFKIGDRIKIGSDIDGFVEEIGLRSTRVRNLDGHLITVPNKTIGNATITNITRRPTIKSVLNIGITYDTPAEKVRQAITILEDVYKKHPQTHDIIIGFNQFADSSLNLNIIHWWKELNFKAYMAGMQEMNLEIKRRFDEAGITFAFPARTVYLRQDSNWRVQVPRDGESGDEERQAANSGMREQANRS